MDALQSQGDAESVWQSSVNVETRDIGDEMRRERQRLQKEIEQEILATEKERKWLEELQSIARMRINPFVNLKLGGDALRAIDDGITPGQYYDICECEAYANEPEDFSDDDFFDDRGGSVL